MLTNVSITHDEMLEIVKAYVADYRTQYDAAESLGVTPAYLSDVLRGKRDVGPHLCDVLGYERHFRFTPKS